MTERLAAFAHQDKSAKKAEEKVAKPEKSSKSAQSYTTSASDRRARDRDVEYRLHALDAELRNQRLRNDLREQQQQHIAMQQQQSPATPLNIPYDAELQAERQLQRWTQQRQLPSHKLYPTPRYAEGRRDGEMRRFPDYGPPSERYISPRHVQTSRYGKHHDPECFEDFQRRQQWGDMMRDGKVKDDNMMGGRLHAGGRRFRPDGEVDSSRDRRR